MYTYVVPEPGNGIANPSGSSRPVAINMLAGNRTDILLLFLRVVRYLFQNGVAGDNLVWNDDPSKTGIWIEHVSPEIFNDDNKRPAIFLDVGEVTYADVALLNNRSSMDGKGNYRKYSHHNLSVSMQVIGRNKIETHKIAERAGSALYLIKVQILEHTVNLESIGPIQIGRVSPIRAGAGSIAGDTTLAFSSTLAFRAVYYLEFPMMQVGDLFTTANFSVTPTSKDGTETAAPLEGNMVYTDLVNKV